MFSASPYAYLETATIATVGSGGGGARASVLRERVRRNQHGQRQDSGNQEFLERFHLNSPSWTELSPGLRPILAELVFC